MPDQNMPQFPEDLEPEPFSPQALIKSVFSTMKTALFMAPLVLVLILVVLALIGPSVGNIFSNITSSL